MSESFSVGQTIRELRVKRGLTGEALGIKTGLSQSKISRLETGTAKNINFAEIDNILNILDASQLIQQQVAAALNQPNQSYNNRFKITYDYAEPLNRERQTNFIRQFEFCAIPALLQIPDYRRAQTSICKLPDDAKLKIMQITMKRQDLIWEKDRKYHLILDEVALYSRPASKSTQIAQLDRVERFIGVNNFKIGIIPYQAGLPQAESCSFVLYDERWVDRNVADSDLFSQESDDIAIYLKLFGMMDQLAVYGDSARAIIHTAIDYFK